VSKYVNKSQWMPPRLPTGRPQTSITSPLLTATRPPSHAGLPELSQLGSGGYPQSLEAKMYKKEDGFPRPPSPALGGLQIPRWLGSNPLSAWWLGLAPATLEFWVRFPNERNQGKQAHPVLKYRVPHWSQVINTHTSPRPAGDTEPGTTGPWAKPQGSRVADGSTCVKRAARAISAAGAACTSSTPSSASGEVFQGYGNLE